MNLQPLRSLQLFTRLAASLCAASLLVSPFAHAQDATQAADADSMTVAVRRLTESQYRNTIADVFGEGIEINARFEPEQRENGLLAIGSATLSLTSSGFEQYFVLASSIADQVLSEERREGLLPCIPNASGADNACAAAFLSQVGERLFRRPLTDAELASRVETAELGASQAEDFYAGLKLALTSLLVAPEYLFRVEKAEPDPNAPGQYRLDGYSKASRLSFMFWNSAPDAELLAAAADDSLHRKDGLSNQLNRLTSSARLEEGARAFFEDMMQLDGFANMVKDPSIYPKFNQLVADSAKEQMLKTVIDLLVNDERDYRDLFTSNETFINRPLASVYQVPYISSEEWAEFEFDEDSERAGILTQIGFLSLWAHPGTSSPTRRGIKIHEIFMCEPTPDPPADVDFSQVTDSEAGTVRGRLLDHMQNTGCTVCHQRSDPPGLALEHFDGLGQLRTMENGQLIDVSADLFGTTLVGAKGLGDYLHDDPRVPSCLVRNVYAYGVAQAPGYLEREFLQQQAQQFADNGYKFPELFKQIALTPEFFAVQLPEGLDSSIASADQAAQQ